MLSESKKKLQQYLQMAALFTMPCYSIGITMVCVFFCGLIWNKWFNFNAAGGR
jgi:uncharacterized membrane protein YjjP (DUF1212 family)